MRTVNLGLCGCGTVGGGLAGIISKHAADIERRCGVKLEIAKATSRTTSKLVAAGIPEERIVASFEDVCAAPEVDIVVELIGGTGVAYEVIRCALEAGKHVVTANKAVMASRGAELLELAAAQGVELAFEASVGGGIPIIGPLKHSLACNEITSVLGIVNGTTNFMLTRMSENGMTYDDALAEAQALGYAEADPTADVDGHDAAAKIAILATLAYGTQVNIEDVPVEGIRNVTPVDFKYAAEMGYAIKLLAIAHRTADGAIDVRVHPTMIPLTHQMAGVNGVFNAIYVVGDSVGDAMFFGEGAGAGAAASSVAGDVIEIGRHITAGVAPFVSWATTEEIPFKPMAELVTRYYIRMTVADQPGALAETAQVFGENGVSIKSMVQSRGDRSTAELIYVTHRAQEGCVNAALDALRGLEIVKEIGNVIRVEEG